MGQNMQPSVAQKELKVMTYRAEAGAELARGVGAKAQPELTQGTHWEGEMLGLCG